MSLIKRSLFFLIFFKVSLVLSYELTSYTELLKDPKTNGSLFFSKLNLKAEAILDRNIFPYVQLELNHTDSWLKKTQVDSEIGLAYQVHQTSDLTLVIQAAVRRNDLSLASRSTSAVKLGLIGGAQQTQFNIVNLLTYFETFYFSYENYESFLTGFIWGKAQLSEIQYSSSLSLVPASFVVRLSDSTSRILNGPEYKQFLLAPEFKFHPVNTHVYANLLLGPSRTYTGSSEFDQIWVLVTAEMKW